MRVSCRDVVGPKLRGVGLAAVGLGMSLLFLPAAAWPRGASSASAPDPLAGVRVGHWVHLQGTAQTDSSALCTEVRAVTGDFLDADWELKGIVRSIDTSRRRFMVGPFLVQVGKMTSFDDPEDALEQYADLRKGMLVDVEGTYSRNRLILAAEVDNETDQTERRSWPPGQIRILGKVERVDFRRRLISAMGIVFQVTDRTRLKTVIR